MNSPTAPTAPPQPLQEALALHRQGKHELAMQRYVAILQQNPGNVDALYYVAMIAIQQEQFAEGLKVIARALELSPSEARLHNLKGQVHLRQNADDEALNSFSRAIEADPAFVDAYGNRGTLLSEMGRAAEALSDFDRALALRPTMPKTIATGPACWPIWAIWMRRCKSSRGLLRCCRNWPRPISTAPGC